MTIPASHTPAPCTHPSEPAAAQVMAATAATRSGAGTHSWQHIHTAARRELLTRGFWLRRQLDFFGYCSSLRQDAAPAGSACAHGGGGVQALPDGNHGENLK